MCICVKENVTEMQKCMISDTDSCVTKSFEYSTNYNLGDLKHV